ncbi:MAG: hypothetical protein ACR2IV_06830 [Bryobacteraceae bacterium]
MSPSRVSRRILLIALLLLCIVYAGDYLSLRYRIANEWSPFGSVEIHPNYAVARKDGRTEFLFDEPCVHENYLANRYYESMNIQRFASTESGRDYRVLLCFDPYVKHKFALFF